MNSLIATTLLLLAIFSFSTAQLSDLHLTEADRQCVEKVGIEKQTIRDAFDAQFLVKEGDKAINNFVLCSFNNTHYVHDDGSLDYDAFETWVKRDFFRVANKSVDHEDIIVGKIREICKDVQGTDAADVAVKVYNCYMKAVLEV